MSPKSRAKNPAMRLCALALIALIGTLAFLSNGQPTPAQTDSGDGGPQTATLFAVPEFANTSQANTGEIYRFQVTPTGSPVQGTTITDSSFYSPIGLAFSQSGELFVTNRGANHGQSGSISRFLNPTGTPVFNGTISSPDFYAPHWAAFGGDELFVAEGESNTVLRLRIGSDGSAAEHGLISDGLAVTKPRGVAVAPWGEVFVSQCCGVDVISRYLIDSNGNAVHNGDITGNGLSGPHGMTFSPQGELFVANPGNNTVSRFTFDPQTHAVIATRQITSSTFNVPIGLTFSPWGELFVCNYADPRISRFTFDSSTGEAIFNGTFSAPRPLANIAFGTGTSTPAPTPSCGAPSSGLVGWWPGDGDATDVVGGHGGALRNGAGFGEGRVGQAFGFDDVDDYVSVPDRADLNFGTGDFTVAYWVNFDRFSYNDNGMIHKDNYDGYTWKGWLFNECDSCPGPEGGGIGFLTRDSASGAYTEARIPTSQFRTSRWYHIAGVRRSNVLYLYVDGVLRASTPENVPTDVSNSIDMRFGSLSPAAPQFFGGRLDEVQIYNRALTPAELSTIAAACNGGPTDNSPPTTTGTLSAQPNAAGWNNTDVTITLNATDESGGTGVHDITYSASGAQSVAQTTASGASASLTITNEGVTTVSYFARDNAGNTETAHTLTVKIDKTAPQITVAAQTSAGTYNAGAWTNRDVTVSFGCTDLGSGLAHVSDPVTLTTEDAGQSVNGSCTDAAGNTSNATFGDIRIDKTPPIISVAQPTDRATYTLGQPVAASYSCSDGASGVSLCAGTVANGANIDTSTVGVKSFNVTARDAAGNEAAPATVNYQVGYAIRALFDQTKASKSGSTMPVRLQLVDAAGVNRSSASIVVQATGVYLISTGASGQLADAGNTNPDFNFRYDASLGGYVFNLKTTGYAAGVYALTFTAGGDPQQHAVQFQVRQ